MSAMNNMNQNNKPVFAAMVSFIDRFIARFFPLAVGGLLIGVIQGEISETLVVGLLLIAVSWAMVDLRRGITFD